MASADRLVHCCMRSGLEVYFGAVGWEVVDVAGAEAVGGKEDADYSRKKEVMVLERVKMNILCSPVKLWMTSSVYLLSLSLSSTSNSAVSARSVIFNIISRILFNFFYCH